MPKEGSAGCSGHSGKKQETLRYILRAHLATTKAIFNKWRYRPVYLYFDMNAGPGNYLRTGNDSLDGSPKIFLEEAQAQNAIFYAKFYEKDEQTIEDLKWALFEDPHLVNQPQCDVEFCLGDSGKSASRHVLAIDWRPAYGLIYSDPNGIPAFNDLGAISRIPQCARVDILIHFSATSIKRCRCSSAIKDHDTLVQRLDLIGKKNWFICKPEDSNAWGWIFLLGTNWKEMSEHRQIGLFNIKTREGQELLEEANLTRKEKNNGTSAVG